MAEPATATELRVPCRYMRRATKPKDTDDWIRGGVHYNQVSSGRLKLVVATASDPEIADSVENLTTYKAVDRWKSGIRQTDLVLLHDGRELNIRSATNWEERNKWLVLSLVHREVVLEGLDG